MATEPFKVVVVGGGPTGLTAAHALSLAGIDFVVLERRENVILDQGASLILKPQTLRVMHQFGLLEELLAIGAEVKQCKAMTSDGHVFKDSDAIQNMRENHGSAPVAFHRAQLVQKLYDGLPTGAKDKCLFGKKVLNISSDDQGVRVTCEDGSTYVGSMVLGADGVHSKTRKIMRKLALEANSTTTWDDEEPFPAAYKCVWCSFPRASDSKSGDAIETQAADRSIMYLGGNERSWAFLYKKLPQTTTKRSNYTEKDIEKMADEFADFSVTETQTVKDIFAEKLTVGMANLEEGIANNWTWKRIVLAGDACHKFTPNAGLGFNNGVQDVVQLCNDLRQTVALAPERCPSTMALEGIFQHYQVVRMKLLQPDFVRSARLTRMHAWGSTFYYLMARYILTPRFVEVFMLNYLVPQTIKHSLVLDYVPAEEPLRGSVSWTYPMKASQDMAAA